MIFQQLGIFGAVLFSCLLFIAYRSLRKTYKDSILIDKKYMDEFMNFYFAITVSIVVMLTCALTITMIYTEILWILLMLPVCLRRSFDNHLSGIGARGKNPKPSGSESLNAN